MFGHCPRIICAKQKLLPYGISSIPNKSCYKTYCPKCQEIYEPEYEKHFLIDGAFFGPNFANMFVVSNPNLFDENNPEADFVREKRKFPIKIYGYKLHESALSRPQEKFVMDFTKGHPVAVKITEPIFIKTIALEKSKERNFIINKI